VFILGLSKVKIIIKKINQSLDNPKINTFASIFSLGVYFGTIQRSIDFLNYYFVMGQSNMPTKKERRLKVDVTHGPQLINIV
jgi:hypothetical protein